MGNVRDITEIIDPGQPVMALVAHDAKKDEMVMLARIHRRILGRFRLIATEATGRFVADESGLAVDLVGSGPFGGDLQIGARIVEGDIDAVIFLRDPLTAHPHDPDIQALLKICDVHAVPVATNRASAEILLHHFARHQRIVEHGISHPSTYGLTRCFPSDPDDIRDLEPHPR